MILRDIQEQLDDQRDVIVRLNERLWNVTRAFRTYLEETRDSNFAAREAALNILNEEN